MKTAICAIIKDEHRFLKEWIDWHLNLGFDAIHLFEDKGSESHEEIVKDYSNVFLRRYENDDEVRQILSNQGNSGRQKDLYSWFAINYRSIYDWVAFIDLDEFLFFSEDYSLERLCNEYEDCPAILLYWKIMGASGNIRKQKNVIESYTEEVAIPRNELNWAHKVLCNLKLWPGMDSLHRTREYVNTNRKKDLLDFCYDKAWINHYFTKSWEDWCDRIFHKGGTQRAHRILSDFFEINPSMRKYEKDLIDSVSHLIPNGTYKLNRNGIIAGGNVKKIQSINKSINEFDYMKVIPYCKVSDTHCVAVIPKCGCSTVALQSLYYHNLITMSECDTYMYRHIKNKHQEADALNKNLDFNSTNLKKVQIIRNPIERFVSAYHTGQYSNTPWKTFLYKNAAQMMWNDRHFTPQYLYTKSPDIYVYIKDYEKFCIENNIMFIPANVNNKQQYLDFTLDEKDKKYIEYLYKEDYDFIESIIKSNKLWTPSSK